MVVLSFDNENDLNSVERLKSAVDNCFWMTGYGEIRSSTFSSENHVDVLRCSVEKDGLKYRCFDVCVCDLQVVRAIFNADCLEEIDMLESLIEALIDLEKRKYSEIKGE